MEIDNALVDKLAMLSRLHFSDPEKKEIKNDLEKMINFIDKLNELNTDAVIPLLHINDNTNIMRDDIVVQSYSREEALINSPVKDNRFFKVPKVIKK